MEVVAVQAAAPDGAVGDDFVVAGGTARGRSWTIADVLALYRSATTPEEKRALLRTLTMMDGDAALEAIDAALEGKK